MATDGNLDAHEPQRQDLGEALTAVLESGRQSIARLIHADTSIRFRSEDGRPDVTLLLDRYPPALLDGEEPAEVEIRLTGEQSDRFTRGRLPLTAAIVAGAVQASGPIRKYLEIDPILRSLLAARAGEANDADRAGGVLGAIREDVDPGLLAIETRDLHKAFGAKKILRRLNLRIPEGSISALLGLSPTASAVCLSHMIGLLRPDSGDVLIRGESLSRMGSSQLSTLRHDIGVMVQDGALFAAMNVFDNVALPLRHDTDLNEHEVRELVIKQLASVGLGNSGDRRPDELSVGMRKRAGLARAMVMNPGIVLLDEPDSGLDAAGAAQLSELLIERHRDHGGTMVIATQNVTFAMAVADHVSFVQCGEVVEDGMTPVGRHIGQN